MHKLFIFFIVIERNDWDTIVQLVTEGIDCVIDNDHILEIAVGNYSEVLYVNPFFSPDAVLSVESVLDESAIRIEIVKHDVRICFVRGCEHHNLIVLISLLKTFNCVRSNVDACLDRLPIREGHINYVVARVVLNVVDAMDKSLIQVKNKGFLYYNGIRMKRIT